MARVMHERLEEEFNRLVQAGRYIKVDDDYVYSSGYIIEMFKGYERHFTALYICVKIYSLFNLLAVGLSAAALYILTH